MTNRVGRRLRLALVLSCANLAGLGASQAIAQIATIPPPSSVIKPLYGNITPFYGNITPFYGNITPFYGNITPFYGNITPFYGNITPFWGNITPFTQSNDAATIATYGTNYDPFWGIGPSNPYTSGNKYGVAYSQISPFWQTESANWVSVQAAWGNAKTSADYSAIANQLQNGILNPAASFWGAALDKKTAAKNSVRTLTSSLLTQAGVTLNSDGSINVASLQSVTPTQQAVFFLNLYDNLMAASGTGHVDWWMGATGWSPALAATQGNIPDGGSAPTVGILDFAVSGGAEQSKKITQYGSGVSNGHGAAVASLILGTADGSGIMGIMPANSANAAVYDPYDATGTTNWTDVGTGISALSTMIFKGKQTPVGVLNASLGVPGWTLAPGWNDALASGDAHGHDLVIAAGNDGVAQTASITWNFDKNPTIIVVGSVGVDGSISNFSNRPGEACLLRDGSTCNEADKLKYRFIVAPGELILVSDGQGGFTRQSGTSLAAPLVSGAITLLQNRWPWLSLHPDETATIILNSATPLGTTAGADATYGVGELNIKASQSPLNWNNLQYYTVINGKIQSSTPLSSAQMQVQNYMSSTWGTANVSSTVLEAIGSTYRDFEIPLSSKLVGQKVTTAAGGQLYQSYLTSSLLAQGGHFADLAASASDHQRLGYTGTSLPIGRVGDLALSFGMAPKQYAAGFRTGNNARPVFATSAALTSDRATFVLGNGEGAATLDGRAAFSLHDDFDLNDGGVDPFLGLASGGAYLGARFRVTDRLSVSAGATQRRDLRDLGMLGLSRSPDTQAISRYSAQATRIGAMYMLSSRTTLHASMTQLHENAAALGVQSFDAADLRDGSDTTGVTLGADVSLSNNLMLSFSGTAGSTRLGQGQLRTSKLGLVSTAAAIALTKTRLLAPGDSLRFTLSKPLHIDAGRLQYDSVAVVDRQTGKLGVISQSFTPTSGSMPVAAELLYGRSLRARGEFSLFGRALTNNQLVGGGMSFSTGAQLQFGF